MSPLIRRLPMMLGVLAVIEVIGDALFVDADPGWVWGLFLVILLGLAIARHPLVLRDRMGRWIAVSSVGLASALAYERSWLAIALVTIGIVSVVQIGRGGSPVDAIPWLRGQVDICLDSLNRMISDIKIISRWSRKHGVRRHRWTWLAAWSIPCLLGSGFIAIFTMANPIINTWVAQLVEWVRELFLQLPHFPAPARFLLWCSVLTSVWVILRVRRSKRRFSVQAMPIFAQDLADLSHSSFIIRCLALFNAIFAVQSLLDLAYLWGGIALPQGLTYASYAHRGAYPLVATALLAALFVLVCFRPDGALQSALWARRLVFAWLGQNVFLVICAVWRLHLYVDVYSLTLWRVTALVWMVLVAGGLALIGWRIFAGRSNRWLINANFLALGITLCLICFIDVRGQIAWHNVTRCKESGGTAVAIDLEYLKELGVEAGPALAWLGRNSHDASVAEKSAKLADIDGKNARVLLDNWRNWTMVRVGIAHTGSR
jgi:Domain of unknown function (DUF4173)